MCAINPRHQAHYVISAYTSDPNMTKEEFETRVMQELLLKEVELNTEYAKIRWHVKEDDLVSNTHKVPSIYDQQ